MISAFIQICLFVLPWSLRRRLLSLVFGYDLAPTSKIGFSIISIRGLRMESNSRLGHLTLARGLRTLVLEEHAKIGHLNWITGLIAHPIHFSDNLSRDPCLVLRRHAAVTHRHLIDCTDKVLIGEFSTFAGWRSQILTHGIDIASSRQRSAPVEIGAYCFVGTGSILLKGSKLPDYCVLGAGSVLTNANGETHKIYSGVPAVPVRDIDPASMYFRRETGFVA